MTIEMPSVDYHGEVIGINAANKILDGRDFFEAINEWFDFGVGCVPNNLMREYVNAFTFGFWNTLKL
jgi:hypothetical protein